MRSGAGRSSSTWRPPWRVSKRTPQVTKGHAQSWTSGEIGCRRSPPSRSSSGGPYGGRLSSFIEDEGAEDGLRPASDHHERESRGGSESTSLQWLPGGPQEPPVSALALLPSDSRALESVDTVLQGLQHLAEMETDRDRHH